MDPETEVRSKLAKMYVLISSDSATPARLKAASEKLSEVLGILTGVIPVPVPQGEESHG